MPELPEVETICRGLSPHCIGLKIAQVIVRNHHLRWPVPADLSQKIVGKYIKSIKRRGKYILIQCDSGGLILHLGMSGYLKLVNKAQPYLKHDHVDIILSNDLALRLNDTRRFGAVLWSESPASHPLLACLGPEPLLDLKPEYLKDRAKRSQTAVKIFIMNAQVVVGVGNIYANEALFMAGIHPQTPAKYLSMADWQNLVSAIQTTLSLAIDAGGTTLKDFRDSQGKPGYFQQQLKVYGREGQQCVQCNSVLNALRLAQRATVYCALCQHKKDKE